MDSQSQIEKVSCVQRLIKSRWGWFAKGLPVLARARALFRVRPYTMTTAERCKALWDQCQWLLATGVPGCFVECGVWRGGSAAIMGLALQQAAGAPRGIHLFDSFEGLPEPTAADGPMAVEYSGGRVSGHLVSVGQCEAGLSEVERFLFDELRLDRKNFDFHVGWFQNTIPADADKLGAIALLRLDGDWYESTMTCLSHLYPKLSRGGIVILDDYYAWAGCRKATDAYRKLHGINSAMQRIDLDAVCWVKD